MLKSLEGTGIAIRSPLLGAGPGAVLHQHTSPSGVEATLRDAGGSVAQLPAKSTNIGVEVKLDQDRGLNLYSSLGRETMYVSNDRGSLTVSQKDGVIEHVGVSKNGGDYGQGGSLARNANYASLLTPGRSVTDLWRLSDELTQKKK